MKYKWFLTAFAAIPFAAAMLALQSCGGEGGPTGNPGGLPAPTAAFLALLSPEQRNATYIGSESCATAVCHGGATDEDGTIYEHWKDTTHSDKGVGCERCHGPGSAHAGDPETVGKILTFPTNASPVICAQCHGPISEQFNLSGHNLLVASPLQSAIQNPSSSGRSSKCIACHSGLVKIEQLKGMDQDPPVELVGVMTDERIRELCEATLTKVPHIANCVTCHNPHKRTGFLTDTGKEVQLRRQTFNTDTVPVGPSALSASFTTYSHGCAQCHNGRGADPSDAKLLSGTSRPNMHDSNQFNMLMGFAGVEGSGPVVRNTAHATAPGQCSKCHMPDSNHSFKVSYDKSCSPCHTAADAAARISSTRNGVIDELLALRNRMSDWAIATYPGQDGNELFWDYTSLISAEGYTAPPQGAVPIQIKRARHNYYFVVRSGDYGAHNAPYARHLITVANENLDELSIPRPQQSRLASGDKLKILERDGKKALLADIEEGDH